MTPSGMASTASDAIRRRWKLLVTVIGFTSVALWCGALGFIVYMAPSRRAPDLATGRVHGWASHGTYVYLSSCEDVMVKVAMVAAGVLFVLAAWIENKTDPWQRRVR